MTGGKRIQNFKGTIRNSVLSGWILGAGMDTGNNQIVISQFTENTVDIIESVAF